MHTFLSHLFLIVTLSSMSAEPNGAGSDEDVIIDHDVQEHPIGGLVNQDPNVIWSLVRSGEVTQNALNLKCPELKTLLI